MTVIDKRRIGADSQREVIKDHTTTDDWQWLIVRADGGRGTLLQRIVGTNIGTDTNDCDFRVAESIQSTDIDPGNPDDLAFPWKLVADGTADEVSDGDDLDIELQTTSGAYAVAVKSSVADAPTTVNLAVRVVQ